MIVPDTTDWTWVVEKTCPECGFDAKGLNRDEIPAALRANAAAWRRLLAGSANLRQRPRPDVWSPLEYACHVRDVCRLYDERLVLMLTEDGPLYPNWDQDETAVSDRYNEQDPSQVAEELGQAAEALADRFGQVSGVEWDRTGARSDGARFTVATFARYFLHDPVHHLFDVSGVRAD